MPSAQGVLTLSGSSAAATFARAWGSAYSRIYPAASVNVVAKSSGAAIADMMASPGTIGMTSRPLTAAERESYAKAQGRPPLEFKVAIDAVAIFVFKDNPLPSISLPQLERIFGAAPKSGAAIERWGQAGAGGDWAGRGISCVGFPAGRGAYEIMRELVLGGRQLQRRCLGRAGVHVGGAGRGRESRRPSATPASITAPRARACCRCRRPAANSRSRPRPTRRAASTRCRAFSTCTSARPRTAAPMPPGASSCASCLSQEGQDAARAAGAFAIPPALAHEQTATLGR